MSPAPLGSVGGVVDRIRAIEHRFAPAPAAPDQVVQTGPAFDPFGEAYQRALETRGVVGSGGTPASSTFLLDRPVAVRTTPVPSTSGAVGSAGSAGGFGSMPIPPVLAPYGNGKIPSSMLTPIQQSGHRLYAPAAQAWDRLVDAAAADGFDLRITDSYRDYEEQVDLVRRKGLYSEGGLAAKPGTSNHGWGLAVDADVRDPALMAWMRENAPRFGWLETVPREPWHWEFRPHQA